MGLNLCLVTSATLEMGIHTHVCEVQLMLRTFAEVKVRREPVRGLVNILGKYQAKAPRYVSPELVGIAYPRLALATMLKHAIGSPQEFFARAEEQAFDSSPLLRGR